MHYILVLIRRSLGEIRAWERWALMSLIICGGQNWDATWNEKWLLFYQFKCYIQVRMDATDFRYRIETTPVHKSVVSGLKKKMAMTTQECFYYLTVAVTNQSSSSATTLPQSPSGTVIRFSYLLKYPLQRARIPLSFRQKAMGLMPELPSPQTSMSSLHPTILSTRVLPLGSQTWQWQLPDLHRFCVAPFLTTIDPTELERLPSVI